MWKKLKGGLEAGYDSSPGEKVTLVSGLPAWPWYIRCVRQRMARSRAEGVSTAAMVERRAISRNDIRDTGAILYDREGIGPCANTL